MGGERYYGIFLYPKQFFLKLLKITFALKIVGAEALIESVLMRPLHRGAFCQFPFRWMTLPIKLPTLIIFRCLLWA